MLQTDGHKNDLAAFQTLDPTGGAPLRVLVTGGAGFIGRHIVARFSALGARVTVLDDLSTGRYEASQFTSGNIFIQGCVLDAGTVAMAAEGADLVVHLASVVGMRRAVGDPHYAFRVSDEGTRNILANTGNAPVVLMSSSCVYGLNPSATSSETEAISWPGVLDYDGGIPGYACGKFQLEMLGLEARAAGRPIQILRPFNIVGPGQRSSFGMVLPTFIRRARQGQPLCLYDDGAQCRSFGDVRTFIDCLIQLLGNKAAWTNNPINVGTSTMTSVRKLAEIVLDEINSSSTIECQPYSSVYPGKSDVRHRRPDTSRLEQLLGPVAWSDIRGVVRSLLSDVPA